MSDHRLLVFDDDKEIGAFVGRAAKIAGYAVEHRFRAEEFRECFSAWRPSHLVLDLMVPDVDGIEVLRFLAGHPWKARIIIMSGMDTAVLEAAARLAEARGLDVVSTLQKPARLSDLLEILHSAKALPKPAELARVADSWVTEADLSLAIKNQELFLDFQPKVVLQTMEVCGFEALVRWRHPVRGLVPPDDFIPFAETTPLIDPITFHIIEIALEQLRVWREQGFETAVAINISGRNLHALDFVGRLLACCSAATIPPDRVTLEVTETALAEDAVEAMDILTRLRLHGFHLSIDDFGTAYASLGQLRDFPFTEIKIDKSFVATVLSTTDSRTIVRAVTDLARSLQMQSVAEGIESQLILDTLVAEGCDVAQGYWISRPLAAAGVLAWLTLWRGDGE